MIEPWVAECLETLDASPELYTTATAMEDLDAVREALGYERVNLYGVSYGTRAALSYLRQFPDRVRSVILDGVAPPSKNLRMDVARDAQRALDLLVERCMQDAGCHEEFPDLARDLDNLMATLASPMPVTLRHPRTGDEETVELQRSMAAFAIRLATYSQETASIVPLLLRSAANGDLRQLAAQFLMTTSNFDDSMADAMGYSVICSEDFPFFDASTAFALNEGTYLGAVQTDSLSTLCPLWPTASIPANFKDPVAVDVPVLLLSGEADPVTPPSNGESRRGVSSNELAPHRTRARSHGDPSRLHFSSRCRVHRRRLDRRDSTARASTTSSRKRFLRASRGRHRDRCRRRSQILW